jgi:Flp pilus assembly protein TadG
MVFIVAAMAAILLMVGLALDVGHATLNKSRLQNATDAAALAAAKMIDSTRSTILATTEAVSAFGANANSSGDQELATAYANGAGTVSVTVQYSATVSPFVPGAPNGPYVRVLAGGFTRPTWFAEVAGINQMTVSATAVAGPSPSINNACNLAPMMVCGDPNQGPPIQPNGLWGYTQNQPVVLKQAAPGGSTAIGPGNFQLIQLGGSGANVVRQNLAGGFSNCLTQNGTVTTQTGNEAGPTAQGLDTRFGDYSGPMGGTQSQYPPDVITTQPTPALTVTDNGSGNFTINSGSTQITASNIGTIFNYDQGSDNYVTRLANQQFNYPPGNGAGSGVPERRILAVPVGACNGNNNGQSTITVLGFACFFLMQEPVQQGNNDYVIGQFIGNCDVNGTPGPAPATGPAPHIIELYHDPNSGDS